MFNLSGIDCGSILNDRFILDENYLGGEILLLQYNEKYDIML